MNRSAEEFSKEPEVHVEHDRRLYQQRLNCRFHLRSHTLSTRMRLSMNQNREIRMADCSLKRIGRLTVGVQIQAATACTPATISQPIASSRYSCERHPIASGGVRNSTARTWSAFNTSTTDSQ
jgi:hypothetical protein